MEARTTGSRVAGTVNGEIIPSPSTQWYLFILFIHVAYLTMHIIPQKHVALMDFAKVFSCCRGSAKVRKRCRLPVDWQPIGQFQDSEVFRNIHRVLGSVRVLSTNRPVLPKIVLALPESFRLAKVVE